MELIGPVWARTMLTRRLGSSISRAKEDARKRLEGLKG
jgi:hypothetical protein